MARVRAAAAAALLAHAAIAACTPFADTPGGTPDDPDAGDPRPVDAGASADADAMAGAECDAPGAFCDDFEGNALLPRAWDYAGGSASSTIALVAGQGFEGSRGLVIAFPAGENEQKFLRKGLGAFGERPRVRFAFAASISGDGYVQGPRIACGIDTGPRLDVGVLFDAGTVKLSVHTPGCEACAPSPSQAISLAPGWRRYRVELDVEPGDAALRRYGHARLYVDDVLEIDTDLGVPLSGHPQGDFLFGLNYAHQTSGTLILDDAYVGLVDP